MDILTRGVPSDVVKNLNMLAASLGVSANTLRLWILEEASLPYGDLRKLIEDRAAEVETNKQKKLVLRSKEEIPRPKQRTRPMHGGL